MCNLFDVSTVPPRALPMNLKTQVTKDMSPSTDESELSRNLVGALIHLTNCTQLDVSFYVGVLARHNKDPRHPHWDAAIDQYVNGSANLAFTYGSLKGGQCTMTLTSHQVSMITAPKVAIVCCSMKRCCLGRPRSNQRLL